MNSTWIPATAVGYPIVLWVIANSIKHYGKTRSNDRLDNICNNEEKVDGSHDAKAGIELAASLPLATNMQTSTNTIIGNPLHGGVI